MNKSLPLIAITGMGRGESPQPGSALVQSLRRRWPNIRIAGIAYDALESGIYAPERPEMSFTMPYPFCGPSVLLDRIDEIREVFPFTVLIPTLDAELDPWLSLSGELEKRGIAALLPDPKALKTRRKQNLAALCARAEVKTPATHAIFQAEQAEIAAQILGGPVMVKGPLYEAERVSSPAQARHVAARLLSEWGGPVLVQKIVDGIELDVLTLGDGKGSRLGSCAIRKLIVSSKGKGYGGMTIIDEDLESAVDSLLCQLKWIGPVEFEFIRGNNGDLYLIEINPRFPAWCDFPSALGCNLAAAAVQQLLNKSVDTLPHVPPGKLFLRHSVDIVCDSEEFSRLAVGGSTQPFSALPL